MGGLSQSELATKRARDLRQTAPNSERLLWWKLRGRRPDGLKFRRQHPEPPFILDFAERRLKLAVEIDGATHSEPEEVAYDRRRTHFLKSKGWTVFRVSAEEVYDALDETVRRILAVAQDLDAQSPPIDRFAATSPQRGEG